MTTKKDLAVCSDFERGLSGASSEINKFDALPEDVRDAYDNNPYTVEMARKIVARDQEWFKRWGVGRADMQHFLELLGNGPGWRERMGKALGKHPGKLPIIVGAFLGALEASGQESEQSL